MLIWIEVLLMALKVTLAEAEEQYWLDREASSQEKIKQLQTEKDASIHKEAILEVEEKIEQLLKERGDTLHKEASQEDKITKLRNEKDACMQKEDGLEEEIEQLLKEKDASMQKEADLVRKNLQLESEKDLWLKKNAGFEEKTNQLENAVAVLNLKGDSLEEKIKQLLEGKDAYLQKEAALEKKILQLESEKDLWLKKEVGFEEKTNKLENEVAILNLRGASLDEKIKHMEKERDTWVQKQVMKLEESRRRSLLQENHLLTENISSLQSQINKLEGNAAFSHFSVEKKALTSENGDGGYQMEAARPLVEKLITENAEVVEKVNELYSELEQRGAKMELSSSIGSDPMDVIPQSANVADTSVLVMDPMVRTADKFGTAYSTHSTSEAGKITFVSHESTESSEDVIIKEAHVDAKDGNALANSSYLESDEIVQIPLDENEVMDASDLETGQNDEKIGVPLSDAPLVGAPLRLISFVARYVSGADLVYQKSGSSAL